MLVVIILGLFVAVMLAPNIKAAALNDSLKVCWSYHHNASDDYGTDNPTTTAATQINATRDSLGHYYYFDGVDDYIQYANSETFEWTSSQDFTIGLWVNITNAAAYRRILCKQMVGSDRYLIFRVDITTCIPRFFIRDDEKDVGLALGGLSICDNNKNFFALVVNRTGDRMYMYENAVVIGSDLDISDIGDINISGPFTVGNRYDLTRDFYGDIDEVAIWDRALTIEDITAIYLNKYNCSYIMSPGADSTPPVLSLYFPSQTFYTNWNFSIIVNASENLESCNINNTLWYSNKTENDFNFFINSSAIPYNNYSYYVECNDTAHNTGNLSFWIEYRSPINGTPSNVSEIIFISEPQGPDYGLFALIFSLAAIGIGAKKYHGKSKL